MINYSLFCLVVCGWIHSTLFAGVGTLVKEGPVSTRFVVEKNVHPKTKTIEIGWWMKREPGWHTYWSSPGDVGVPPNLEWTLPEGIIFRNLDYAPPQLVKMFKVFAHGHRGESLFICTFDVKRELAEGEVLTFKAKSSWLACYNTCLPTFADLEIKVPVNYEVESDLRWNSLFNEFRKSKPVEPPAEWIAKCDSKLSTSGNLDKEFVTLRFPIEGSGKNSSFRFFAHGRFVRSNIFQIPKKLKNNKGENLMEISMELSYWRDPAQKNLTGLLFSSNGWDNATSKFYKVKLPLRK